MPLPQPQIRNALGSSYFPQFLLPFHLSVLGRMEEGCPLRGAPRPTSSLVIPSRPVHTAQAKGFPSAHAAFTANAVLAQSPSPIRGPCLP